MLEKLMEIVLDIVNQRPCPFQPEDNPFPEWCDKRIMFSDECKKCAWRK